MKNPSHEEPASTDRLLASLTLAIEEARLVRSIIESKGIADRLRSEKPVSRRLAHIDREIEYLESRLAQLRNRTNRA